MINTSKYLYSLQFKTLNTFSIVSFVQHLNPCITLQPRLPIHTQPVLTKTYFFLFISIYSFARDIFIAQLTNNYFKL